MFKKDALQIIAFKTYGTESHLYLRGRALEDENIELNTKGFGSIFRNTWKRFETDEVKNASVQITLKNKKSLQTVTDLEGYFLIDQTIENLHAFLSEDGWLPYTIKYQKPENLKNPITHKNTFSGEMLVVSPHAEFGVISDVDDTILHTGVASLFKWRAVFNTFFIPVFRRKAIEGTADFYRKLHKGKTHTNSNPIFYVSNSPWNLYAYLDFFLSNNNFPKGALLLRDLRHLWDKTPKPKISHKHHEIQNILNTYPKLSFVLIGDCGEHDPDIYKDIVAKNPNRISAMYLRSVKNQRKMLRVKKLFQNYKEVEVVLVYHTKEAIAHAKRKNLL